MKVRTGVLLLFLLGCIAVILSGCQWSNETEAEYGEVAEEKKLVVYTSHKEEVYGPVIREFEERTGIWVQVRQGGTTELLEDIRKGAGKTGCDVMFGGGVESYQAYLDCFQPYICRQADMLQDDFISPEGYWTVFSKLPIVFIYNNKLVSREEAPVSWGDFLTDRMKGKIAFADPGKSGTSCTALAAMIQLLGGADAEDELLERFVHALDGKVSGSSGAVLDEVNSGIRLVGITLEESARKRIARGEDISMVYPSEGTSVVPDGTALVKGAPHEENAKLFLDFTVSEDVQKILVDQFCRRSVRKSSEEDEGKKAEQKNVFGTLTVMDFDLAWASKHQKELLDKWEKRLQ